MGGQNPRLLWVILNLIFRILDKYQRKWSNSVRNEPRKPPIKGSYRQAIQEWKKDKMFFQASTTKETTKLYVQLKGAQWSSSLPFTSRNGKTWCPRPPKYLPGPPNIQQLCVRARKKENGLNGTRSQATRSFRSVCNMKRQNSIEPR